jgi:hypothetical protein
MSNRRRSFAAFAASIALAAAGLGATPAPAQTGGGSGENYYGCNDPTSSGGYGSYPWGYGCCQYDVYSGGWYRMYVTHWEPCTGPYGQSSEEPDDRASEEPAEPSQ